MHVIIGDANLSEISTYLKVGTTALILTMIEEKALGADLGIADPVAELRAVSHDPSLTHRMRLRDGRRLTALDLQWAYYERVRSFVDERYGADADAQTLDVLDRWERVLDRLGRDVFLCADELDWVAKLRLLEGYREREKLGWALAQAPTGRPAVFRRTAGEGPLPPAGDPGLDEDRCWTASRPVGR